MTKRMSSLRLGTALAAVVAVILLAAAPAFVPAAQALPVRAATGSTLTAASQACPAGILPRRASRDLTATQWTRFTDAVRQLQQRPVGSLVTPYDTLVRRHLDTSSQVHNAAPYLPWHRYYLRQFEIRLQTVDPGLTIPYWDWTEDSQSFQTSVTWRYLGGNGAALPGRPVIDGPFATWSPAYVQPHRLSRRWLKGLAPSAEVVNRALQTSASYPQLRQSVEQFYSQVNVLIGGDMATMHAPNDPVYLLHLAFLDKLWSDWQLRPGNATAYGGRNSDGSAALSTDRLPGFVATVRDTFNISSFCYSYAPPAR